MNNSICFVIPGWVTKHRGGAEWQCYLFSEELLKRGWQVEVFTYKNKIVNKEYFNEKIKYYYYKSFIFLSLNFLYSFFLLFKTNSEYYYIRTDARFLRAALVLFGKIKMKKVIYSLASDDDAKNITYISNYSNSGSILKKIIRGVDLLIVDIISHISIYKVDKVISQTDQQKKILKKYTGLRSTVIHNSFKFRKMPENKNNIILWVANMRPLKRPELFIRLAKEFEKSGWQFIMIGKINPQFDEIIENAKAIKNFRYLRSLSYAETNKWFAKAKILVNTSTVEGFSNTFLQAWFYKVIIVSMSVDPSKILANQNTGFYGDDNYQNTVQIIDNLINNYNKLSKDKLINGRKYLEINFNLKNNVDKLERLLNTFIFRK